MKHTDIEAIMTAKVAEYITNGYILSTATMSGHQGEVGKVDMKKGTEIIRILLTNENAWDDNGEYRVTTLTIGRAQKKIHSNRPFDTMATTIWNNELDIIDQMVWYSVDSRADNFTDNRDDLIEQHKKQMKRWRMREAYRKMRYKKDVTSDAAKAIVLPFIHHQNRCGRVKVSDIERIVKYYTDEYDKMHYSVTLKNGKSFRIK